MPKNDNVRSFFTFHLFVPSIIFTVILPIDFFDFMLFTLLMNTLPFYVSAPKYIEALLEAELRENGISSIKPSGSGAFFEASLKQCYRYCLHSRLASRVVMEIASFECYSEDALYEAAKAIPWEKHFSVDSTFSCRATTSSPHLKNAKFASLRLKDAIADRFREVEGRRPSVDKEFADVGIDCKVGKELTRISIDFSGGTLSRRGYRKETTTAPLRENTAAAFLLRAGWPKIAEEGGAFLDPMCGSGTLLIEAAMMATDFAPGLLRSYFGFEGWSGHKPDVFEKVLAEAKERAEAGKEKLPVIRGYDKTPSAIAAASINIGAAGFSNKILIAERDIKTLNLPEGFKSKSTGLIAVNPPYGQRLKDANDIRLLYKALGDFTLAQIPKWQFSLITVDKELSFATGRRSYKKHSLMNGSFECVVAHFKGEQVLSRKLSPSGEQFANRLVKNEKKLRKWIKNNKISSYRLYDADLPDYNVAIDIYVDEKDLHDKDNSDSDIANKNKHYHIQEYAPPVNIEATKRTKRLREVVLALEQTFEADPGKCYVKTRLKKKGPGPSRHQDDVGERHIIREGDAKFYVNFTDFIETGIFLEHSLLRTKIAEEVKGKSFLNLFSYTSCASVRAALSGAKRTLSVDSSTTYIQWSRDNYDLNELDTRIHLFEKSDVFRYLENMGGDGDSQAKDSFDLILLDPPAFSKSNSEQQRTFDIQTDHGELLDLSCSLLSSGGKLYFSNSFKKFKMEWTPSESFEMKDITSETLGPDFERNHKIHRCWEIVRLKSDMNPGSDENITE